MSVRSFAPGKEVLAPRGMWSQLAQKRKGSPSRASFMQNCRVYPGVVRSRPGTTVVAPATGKVTGLFNWISPAGKNYVLYRDGVALRSLEQPATRMPLLNNVGAMLRPSFADLNVWTYFCGYDAQGNGTVQCRTFDGVNVDVAFRAPVELLAAGAVDAGDGQASAGTHFFGFVYQNRSGFAGKPTTTVDGQPISLTLDASLRRINVSVQLPPLNDGGGNAVLYLIMTRADNAQSWYFVPTDAQSGSIGDQPVPLNTTATLNFVANLSDEDLAASADSANPQFLYLSQDANGNGPFQPSYVVAYGQRMCYGVGSKLYVSEINNPQQVTEDQHVVIAPNQRAISFAFPLPGSTDLFLTGAKWTSRVTDNSDVPATWAQPIKISDSLGAPFPACVCYRTGGGHAWIVTESGPYLFTGTYAERPLTYLCADQWRRVNWAAASAIETADDVVNLLFYVAVPLDGATEPSHLFVFDYTNGTGFDEVDIGLDKFNRATFSSVGVVTELASNQSNLWIGPAGGTQTAYSFTVTLTDGTGAIDSVTCGIDVTCP